MKSETEQYLEERVQGLEVVIVAVIKALRNAGFPQTGQHIENLYRDVK